VVIFFYSLLFLFSISSQPKFIWPPLKSSAYSVHYLTGGHFKRFFSLPASFLEILDILGKWILFWVVNFPSFFFLLLGILKGRRILGAKLSNNLIYVGVAFSLLFFFYRVDDIVFLLLPAVGIGSLWYGIGISYLINKFNLKFFGKFIIFILITSILFFSYQSLGKISLRDYFKEQDICSFILSNAKKEATLESDWHFATTFRYLQLINNTRQDVKIKLR
jgi:hypothetical protein